MIAGMRSIVVGLFLSTQCMSWAQLYDCSVAPRPKDNFLEADFRLLIPAANEPVRTILVFIPGTDGDGRSAVSNPAFCEMARACHAALLGCYFRGEGLSYDNPAGGSGRALDQALASLSTQAHQPQLAAAPLLLVGFSQGSMLAFNYVCWRPERVKAFAALRAIFPRLEPQEKSFQVPGLLAAGENDEAGRTRSIASAFLKARGHDAKWAFLFERNSGHDVGRSLDLVKILFETACRADSPPKPVILDIHGTNVRETASDKDLCYFPNQEMANVWKELNQPTSMENLLALRDKPRLQDLISIGDSQVLFECENGQSQEGVIRISSQTPGITITGLKMSGDGFNVERTLGGALPLVIQIGFAPKNMPWGRAKGVVTLSGRLEGVDAGTALITATALVNGAVTAAPSFVYLGVVSLGQATDQWVLLKSDRTGIHLAYVKSPEEITASVELPDKEGNQLLRVHWSPKAHLGRMEGYIDLTFDAPQKGLLRIPVVGFVALPRSANGGTEWDCASRLLISGQQGCELSALKGQL